LEEQIRRFRPQMAALMNEEAAAKLRDRCRDLKVNIVSGMQGTIQAATYPEGDLVIAAIVGAAGLVPTLSAIRAKKPIALANKEAMVMAGQLVTDEAKRHGVTIFPVDSEHSAIFQSMEGHRRDNIRKLLLTASGGPLLKTPLARMRYVKPEQALKHPNWKMGAKITIDSATLMNKGLEVIEARWLFDIPYSRIEVLIHPQSVIHSMVEYVAYLTVNDLWRTESPSKRFGHGIGLLLSRYLAFLDDNYRLGQLIDRVNIPDRPGVRRPFMEVWKLSETSEDRQYFLWPRLMSDQRLLAHARAVWLARGRPPAAADLIARICSEVAQDVALIRSRGGEVVFVRPPSSGAYYEREQTAAPRAATWDRLLRETGAPGIHFEDYQDMQDLEIPEMSHLSRDSATRFTRAYVEVLVGQYPWLDRTTRAGAAT
jgi:hypothetical protein